MKWYIQALKKYAVFKGRANRKEYWYFIFVNFIIVFIVGSIEGYTKGLNYVESYNNSGIIVIFYGLAVLVPVITVSVRRLHDINKNGWWVLINLIPYIGGIVLLIFMIHKGDSYNNRYGAPPELKQTD